jgi:UDP-N-acetylglucosamine 2-epimerase (non-hydrolysing)
MAPVVHALRAGGHDAVLVATGQQDDPLMLDAALAAVGLVADARWHLPSGPARSGALLGELATTLASDPPDAVMAVGDTTTVALSALAARGAGVAFLHLEAGLRSFNERSLEETNRRVAAACAALNLAPTARAAAFLAAEGVPDARVRVVGNPIVDALRRWGPPPVPVADRDGVLVTAHRATNVDDPARLARLVALVGHLAHTVGPVTFPVHPRTAGRLAAAGLDADLDRAGVHRCPPLPWADLLDALRRSRVAVTDSGGLQEEAAWYGVPVVVLRRSTPRWEGVEAGIAVLAGLADDAGAAAALAAAGRLVAPDEQARVATVPCPYGDGWTGERVAALLADPSTPEVLRLREPDLTGGAPW